MERNVVVPITKIKHSCINQKEFYRNEITLHVYQETGAPHTISMAEMVDQLS